MKTFLVHHSFVVFLFYIPYVLSLPSGKYSFQFSSIIQSSYTGLFCLNLHRVAQLQSKLTRCKNRMIGSRSSTPTSSNVVETLVTVTDNSPFQDYPHPDDHTTRSTVTPGFKPFTVKVIQSNLYITATLFQMNGASH